MSKYYAPQPKKKDKPVKVKPVVVSVPKPKPENVSKASQLKKNVNWESSCARCDNCANFRPRKVFLIDSLPRTTVPHCHSYGFITNPNSICDAWVDKVTKVKIQLPEKPFTFAELGKKDKNA